MRALVLFISLSVSLVIMEGACRLFFGHPNPLPIDPHEERSFTSRPSSRGVFPVRMSETNYDYVPYQISSIGLRDREYSVKGPSEVRIALLGDSMTMGWGLASKDTMARQLEKMIYTSKSPEHVRVINAGHFGYGPVQELSFLGVCRTQIIG